MEYDSNLLTLKELCGTLSISIATGRNWLKLKKLIPTKTIGNAPYFSKSYVNRIKKELLSGTNHALKSRRNKKFISGNGIYKSYISASSENNQSVQAVLELLSKSGTEPTMEQINLLIAECALQLLCQRTQIATETAGNLLIRYLSQELDIGIYLPLIEVFIVSHEMAYTFVAKNKSVFSISYHYKEQEDILGLLYISLKNIGSRKASGSYFTPFKTVHRLINGLLDTGADFTEKTVFDPCCGTGNFLLQLPNSFDISQIYGNDIDETSVAITRLNLALKFRLPDITLLYQHITVSDFLTEDFPPATPPSERGAFFYDFIIGNPPWGYSYSDPEKERLRAAYQCILGKSVESYDLFIERALSLLNEKGTLAFVLPKSILNVKSHAPIREMILKENSITRLEFLESDFDKVQCPSIILQLIHTGQPHSCVGMTVTEETRSFTIGTERSVTADCLHFLTDDTEYQILEKIMHGSNQTTLKNQADFALGIVTGNNKKYISHKKTAANEIILKGSDINRYQIKECQNFITFTPEEFQQVAAEKYYRAPEKLLYRFICNEPVFAYDDKQTLSLNSCNIVIPHVTGLDIKYILAVLNSRITQFIFKKQFDSVKVLRSHIEQIPIPVIDSKAQGKIIEIVDVLLKESNEKKYLIQYDELDKIIAELFGLTNEEYQMILVTLKG